MKKNLTEVVFILDKSGSMGGLERDTIGGFNSMLEKQKQEEGEALISTIFFSYDSEVIHDRMDIREVDALTPNDYRVGGSTALIDAIGGAIKHITNVHKYIRKEDTPEHTLFVIITDGEENSSRKYSSDEVKKLIEKKKKSGWEFIFLGANIDAIETARNFGIAEEMAVNYKCDARGTAVNYAAVNAAVRSIRTEGAVSKCWKESVEADFESRA